MWWTHKQLVCNLCCCQIILSRWRNNVAFTLPISTTLKSVIQSSSSLSEVLHHKFAISTIVHWPFWEASLISMYGSGWIWWAFFFLSISVCFWFTGLRCAAKQLSCLPTKWVRPSQNHLGFSGKNDVLAAKLLNVKSSERHIYIFPSIL